ncbi:MAG: PilC/PilY family type IV pilus protein [Candidatus Aminicenantes bacterium]|nr:PilC/PilY family type IV pilus protein [Candidatus Aminicenantes bacterium]
MTPRIIRIGAAALALALVLLLVGTASSQSCVENTGTFAETFSDASDLDTAASSVKYWFNDPANPRDIMTNNRVGANFETANPSYVPAWINALTANDFDLDGWPDYIGTSSSYSNCLAFVRNLGAQGSPGTFQIASWIDGSTGNASGWPTRGVGGAAIDNEGHCGMTSGDYDGDGDIDFILIVSTTAGSCDLKRVWLYENTLISGGRNTGVLSFVRTDLTSAWSGTVGGIAWSSTMVVSIDFDADGDVDVIMGNRDGDILKITNTKNNRINAQTFLVETTPLISTGWGGRGVNTVSVADFDGSPGLDIIVGSVSTADLRFYSNDGTGHFNLAASFTDGSGDLHNNMYDGGATVSLVYDFDSDGDQDLIIGTDNYNYGGNGYGGKVYYFKNGGSGNFTVKLVFNGPLKSPAVYDFDLGAVLDFNKDGSMDFLIADGNDSQYYYLFVNSLADVYNLSGLGLSLNLTPTMSGRQYAITKARMTAIDQRIIGSSSSGLTIDYFVSNNDGQNWEYYAGYDGSQIVNVTNQPWHDFHTYGSSLRWKAVLTAAEDAMTDYTDASYETPVVDTLRMEYVYVERREYSRSSAAATTSDLSGRRRKLLISSSFIFPGSEGQLRAYDVTNIRVSSTGGSTIQTISQADPFSSTGRTVASGGEIFWDAGQQLQVRDPANRTIYCSYRPNSSTAYSRRDFTTANTGTLASLLVDPDADNAGLIEFVRGVGRSWKLGDILHSSPTIMGPPAGDSVAMGAGYAAFMQAWAGRTPVVFVGANDGMLHCFELATGRELWGWIPYNLIPKLKNMSGKDAYTGERYFRSDLFVDGTPSIGDAYINGAWKTVLICGQGGGYGSSIGGGLNYYFALDVTDPANPLPLWELTNANMGETWSVPAIGQVTQSTTARWVAFMGSGYDNSTSAVVGNRFYVVRLDTGAILVNRTAANVNTNVTGHPHRYTDIYNAIPGSPSAVDINRDGKTEYVYVGDLDGRLYRMPLSSTSTTYWTLNAIYTDRCNYPIITKPALYPDPASGGLPVRVFFGTGGDDRAPADRPYALIDLRDDGTSQTIEWYMGDAAETGLASSLRKGSFGTGEKVWADPVISDKIVYFSTLMGSIENVNPCLNLASLGRLYARFVQSVAGSVLGGSALKSSSGTAVESLQLASKARKAVTIGERQKAPGSYKREVYIQEYDSTIERLEQPVGALLRITSWREIFKVIR